VDGSQYWHQASRTWINAAAAFDPILPLIDNMTLKIHTPIVLHPCMAAH
jgi:hypothetical protein